MSDARFDILFEGALAPGADPFEARQRLRAVFKLDTAGVERLFSGKPVVIKRDVDAATAARYKRVFEEAGAILDIQLRASAGDSDTPAPDPSTAPDTANESGSTSASTTPPKDDGLGLAPMDGFLEAPHEVKMPDLDTSGLALVNDPEWSLEDCEPPAPKTPQPDTSHLKLMDIDENPDDNDTR